MTDGPRRMPTFQRVFLTGFVALFPLALTIGLIWLLWDTMLRPISLPIAGGIIRVTSLILAGVSEHAPDLDELRVMIWPQVVAGFLAIVLAVVLIYFLGLLLRTFLGRQLLAYWEWFLSRLPVIKRIYPYAKQIGEFLFGEREIRFNRVVAIQYPRPGAWSLGFATSGGPHAIGEHTGQNMVAVFVPTSPTPFTGWTVMLAAGEVVDLDMSVDEAIRFTVSCGVITPRRFAERTGAATDEEASGA
jgi:uncharacterized membrane protein